MQMRAEVLVAVLTSDGSNLLRLVAQPTASLAAYVPCRSLSTVPAAPLHCCIHCVHGSQQVWGHGTYPGKLNFWPAYHVELVLTCNQYSTLLPLCRKGRCGAYFAS